MAKKKKESKVQTVARKNAGERKVVSHDACGIGEVQWVRLLPQTGHSRMVQNCSKCGILPKED